MRQVIGLEDLSEWLAGGGDAEARRGLGWAGRLMAQRLPQPADAIILAGRPDKYRGDQIALKILGQVLVDLLFGGLHVLEQLLQERIVEIGQLLDDAGPGLALPVPEILWQRDQIGGLAGPIAVGALADQIDIAGDLGFGPA